MVFTAQRVSSEDVVLFVLINLGDSITVNPRSGVMCELTEVRRLFGGVSGVEVVCFYSSAASFRVYPRSGD